jgi:hypothetical protein
MKASVSSSSGIKFTAAGSAGTGKNPFLAGKGKGGSERAKVVENKFGKSIKDERTSPSAERCKSVDRGKGKGKDGVEKDGEWTLEGHTRVMGLLDEKAIGEAEATQGLTQQMEGILEKEELDKELEKQAAADKKKHAEAVGTEAGGDTADGIDGINLQFNKEKEKRRDLEDKVDELKDELGWQRESIAKATHTVSKLVGASLQMAERSDGVTIFIIRKKGQQTSTWFLRRL